MYYLRVHGKQTDPTTTLAVMEGVDIPGDWVRTDQDTIVETREVPRDEIHAHMCDMRNRVDALNGDVR